MKPFRRSPERNEVLKTERGVPFVEETDHYFLQTVIPSRKATRDYLPQGADDDQP